MIVWRFATQEHTKIIFANFQRKGFINRYTKDKAPYDISKTYCNYRFVSLSKNGLDFLNATSLLIL